MAAFFENCAQGLSIYDAAENADEVLDKCVSDKVLTTSQIYELKNKRFWNSTGMDTLVLGDPQ